MAEAVQKLQTSDDSSEEEDFKPYRESSSPSSSSSDENEGAVGRPLQKDVTIWELEEDTLLKEELKEIEERVAGLTVQEQDSEFEKLETEANKIYRTAWNLEIWNVNDNYCYEETIEMYKTAWRLYKKAVAVCPEKRFDCSKIREIEYKLQGDTYYQEALRYDPRSEDSCRQALYKAYSAKAVYYCGVYEESNFFMSYMEAGKLAEKINADLHKLLGRNPVVEAAPVVVVHKIGHRHKMGSSER